MTIKELASTGNPDIDGTHRQLIESILNIEKVIGTSRILTEVSSLLQMFVEHKSEEEMLMDIIDYPYAEPHKLAHLEVVEKIKNLIILHNAPQDKINWLVTSLRDALVHHVEHYDVSLFRYSDYLNKLNARLV